MSRYMRKRMLCRARAICLRNMSSPWRILKLYSRWYPNLKPSPISLIKEPAIMNYSS